MIPKFRKVKIGNFKLLATEALDLNWLERLVASLDILPPVSYAPNRARARVKLPADFAAESAFVKLYAHTDCQSRGFRRTNPFRRLLPRYAAKEAKAYLRFQRSGLAVPEMLVFGEEWRFGIRNQGLFAAETVDGPSLQSLLNDTRDPRWIDQIFDTITRIHQAGFTHGDAHLVNFLERDGNIYCIDIDKSKPISEKGRLTDLINIMSGIFLEIDDPDRIGKNLVRYGSSGMKMTTSIEELLRIARKKSQGTGELDKSRYYGAVPPLLHL